jgi:hypothetical protein
VLAEEILDDKGAKLENSKSLKCLAQEIGVSKSSARRATQLQKLRPHKNNSNSHLAGFIFAVCPQKVRLIHN